MNDSTVQLQGWVGNEPDLRDANGVPVTSFRLGVTPRYLKDGRWTDGATSWFTVNAWRGLAHNVAGSVHSGDAVYVVGRVRTDTWKRDGLPDSTTWVVDARVVGHDLSRGVSSFVKTTRTAGGDAGADGVEVAAAEPEVTAGAA